MKKICELKIEGTVGVCIDNINVDMDNPEGDLDFDGALEAVKETYQGELFDVELKLRKTDFHANGGSEFEYHFDAKWVTLIDVENENEDYGQKCIDAYNAAKNSDRFGYYECNSMEYDKNRVYDFDDTKPVVWENTTENNIREAIVFRVGGFYCGYVGVPKGMDAYAASNTTLERYVDCVHGGVTYADKECPTDIKSDGNRHWVGFDYAHFGDGIDYALTEKMYGKEVAEHNKELNITYYDKKTPVSFGEVYKEVKELTKELEQYKALEKAFDRPKNLSVDIEVPFKSVVMEQEDSPVLLDYLIDKEGSYENEYPETLTVHIPLDVLERFYQKNVDNDNGIIYWLENEYTTEDTESLLSWLRDMYDMHIEMFENGSTEITFEQVMNTFVQDPNGYIEGLREEAKEYRESERDDMGLSNEDRDDI